VKLSENKATPWNVNIEQNETKGEKHMKKLLVIALAVALMGIGTQAIAYDGDFEISGHINTGFGFQYNSKALVSKQMGAFTEEGMLAVNFGVDATATRNSNNFNVLGYVGDVELDIAKTFGENIRLRVDLDFGNANINSYRPAVANMIEQAYATVNIPVGYGLEFLIGRFNAPMGFEAVDNNDNDLPFHTAIFNFLRPQNLTGIKFYYPFSDLVDLHFWIANNLRALQAGNESKPHIPAGGLRLGFTFGNEGQESTLGISGAVSPEARNWTRQDKWGELSYIGDLDFNFWVNEVFAIGGEGFFRRDGAIRNAKDNYYFAGLLNLHYVFSDVWDGTLRYTYSVDKNGGTVLGRGAATVNGAPGGSQYNIWSPAFFLPGTATATVPSAMLQKLQLHQIDLGINYHITDGAKIMTMYRFEMGLPAKSIAGSAATRSYANRNKTGMNHTLAANFAYEF